MALDSVMAKAFLRAGYEAGPDLLYVEMARIIGQASRDIAVALRLLQRNESLCARVLTEALHSVLRDMDAKSLLGVGHLANASNGHAASASIQQSNGEAKATTALRESATGSMPSSSPPVEHGGGQKRFASNGHQRSAAPCSPSEDGSGQTCTASDGQATRAAPSSPVRPAARVPNPPRGFAAIASAQRLLRRRFDTLLTHDKRPWRGIGMHEMPSLGFDGMVADGIKEAAGPLNESQRFLPAGDLITDDQFDMIVENVKARRDAA